MEYQFTSVEELPPFLNAKQLSAVLGVSMGTVYTLLRSRDFPTTLVGKRMIVEKARFLKWIEERTAK